jgi:hypothetical protein
MLGYILRKEPCEFYRVNLTQDGVIITLATSLYQHMMKEILSQKKQCILSNVGIVQEKDTTICSIPFPYISYPNTSHKKINWEGMRKSAESLSVILSYLSCVYDEAHRYPISEKSQLVLMECFSQERYSSITVGFSPKAMCVLKENAEDGKYFPSIVRTMTVAHEKLSETTTKGFLRKTQEGGRIGITHQNFSAIIRKEGVPNFNVPGNCACLGANPDNFKIDGFLTPHNIDTPLQLLTMVVGVVSFWNETLKPLCYE